MATTAQPNPDYIGGKSTWRIAQVDACEEAPVCEVCGGTKRVVDGLHRDSKGRIVYTYAPCPRLDTTTHLHTIKES